MKSERRRMEGERNVWGSWLARTMDSCKRRHTWVEKASITFTRYKSSLGEETIDICWSIFVIYLGFLQLTAISESGRMCQFNAPMTISEIKHENVRCCLLPWRPWSVGLLASRWINCVIHFGLCSFGLCVPKLYFHLNLKWHCLHWRVFRILLSPFKG